MDKNSGLTIGIIAVIAAIFYFLRNSSTSLLNLGGNKLAATTSPFGSASGVLTPVTGAVNALSTLLAFNEEPATAPNGAIIGQTPAQIAAASAGGVSNPGSPFQLQQISTPDGIQTVGLLNTSTGATESFVPAQQDVTDPFLSQTLVND
jgi:hypothetical protein